MTNAFLVGARCIALVLLLGSTGQAWATGTPRPQPTYCAQLLQMKKSWQGYEPRRSVSGRSHALSRWIDSIAQQAADSERPDVAEALTLSARWVLMGSNAGYAAHARDTRLGERMMKAGRAANPTIKADCGFAPYPTQIPKPL
ncbi:MAG: hypothetical protein WAS21_15455 [Geminicoccaceae bacterium]